jgi:hypothetical protein
MRIMATLFGVLLLVGMGFATEPGATPIRELEGLTPKEAAFRPAKPLVPLVLKSLEKAARYLPEADVEKLKKEVDFTQEVVLLFAWEGSGQDRLTHEMAESQPEQVAFTREPGRTRDLRPHVHAYVVSAKVKWTVDGVAPKPGVEEVTWEEIQEIIKTRDVESVMQTHQRRVTVFLTDGSRYETTEPGLDDVVSFILELGKPIPIATE